MARRERTGREALRFEWSRRQRRGMFVPAAACVFIALVPGVHAGKRVYGAVAFAAGSMVLSLIYVVLARNCTVLDGYGMGRFSRILIIPTGAVRGCACHGERPLAPPCRIQKGNPAVEPMTFRLDEQRDQIVYGALFTIGGVFAVIRLARGGFSGFWNTMGLAWGERPRGRAGHACPSPFLAQDL
ncbi:hypothetical protein [Streptomyces sp. NPDC059819]|uniref:hypothetical protein n=1 Tax=Streptomyces sp. NPDC059819 TaxID=3346963 RepID=UPI0036691B75